MPTVITNCLSWHVRNIHASEQFLTRGHLLYHPLVWRASVRHSSNDALPTLQSVVTLNRPLHHNTQQIHQTTDGCIQGLYDGAH